MHFLKHSRALKFSVSSFITVCFGLILLFFIVANSLNIQNTLSIQNIAQNIEHTEMPGLLQNQNALITLGTLRRLAEVINTSQDYEQRQQIRLSAQELSQKATLDTNNKFNESTFNTLADIEKIADAKDAIDTLWKNVSEQEQVFKSLVILMSNYAQEREDITLLFQLIAIDMEGKSLGTALALFTEKKNTEKLIKGIAQVYTNIVVQNPELASTLKDPLEKGIAALEMRLKLITKIYEDTVQLREFWAEVDTKLILFRENIAIGSENIIGTLLKTIIRATEQALNFSMFLSIALVVFLIFYYVLSFLLIIQPLRWTSKTLSQLQSGEHSIKLPSIQVKEIDEIARLLDQFSSHLADLYHRTSQMEEDVIQKQNFEEVMRAVFKVSLDGYIVWTPEQLLHVSKGACNLLSFSSEQKALQDNQLQSLSAQRATFVLEQLNKHSVWREEIILEDSKGISFPCEVTHLEIKYNGQESVLSYLRDLREQKKYEDALLLAKQKAEVAAQAKGEFMARMSHELRTPMNGVLGLVRIILASEPSPKHRELLEKIQTSANILLKVINDILDFSEVEKGTFSLESKPFSLLEVIDNISSLLEPQANAKNISFVKEIDREVFANKKLVGDELRLNQILLNICGNAIKFTEKGSVCLEVKNLGIADGNIEILFKVRDTGLGIPEDKKTSLFQAFSQVDSSTTRKYGGTGLGLIISKILVEQMGGQIYLQSTVGKGSEFSFTLKIPLHTNAPQEGANLELTGSEVLQRFAGKKILVAEDNEINQEIIYSFLTELNLSVTLANNGQEALDILEKQNFDCIFMDIQMPVMDGLTAAKTIRQTGRAAIKNIPIIALSAHVLPDEIHKSFEAGINAHLEKPLDYEKILKCLAQYLA